MNQDVERDIERLRQAIMNMRNGGEGTVLLVEGGAGLGVDQFKRKLRSSTYASLGLSKWAFVTGTGDPFNIYTDTAGLPVWKEIFENLREIKGYRLGDRDLLAQFKEYVAMRREDLEPYLGLIKETLNFGIKIDKKRLEALTKQDKTGTKKTVYTIDLLSLFLEFLAGSMPIVVMVYSCQYLKAEDWHMTRRLASLIKHGVLTNVTLILSSEPVDNQCYTPLFGDKNFVNEYKALKELIKKNEKQNMIVTPKVWTLPNTREFVENWIGLTLGYKGQKLEVCDLIVNCVHERAGGRPGFCEMFLTSLNEQDVFKKDKKSNDEINFRVTFKEP
eukprot:UN32457